ncbi:conserved hypothetical protein [Candidatus Magnetomoraceae bacterium gMMP-15]
MQLTIDLPELLPNEKILQLISDIKKIFVKDGITFEIKQKISIDDDPWDNLDIDEIAVDTGIEDFAKNHDHYLYGTPKQS